MDIKETGRLALADVVGKAINNGLSVLMEPDTKDGHVLSVTILDKKGLKWARTTVTEEFLNYCDLDIQARTFEAEFRKWGVILK